MVPAWSGIVGSQLLLPREASIPLVLCGISSVQLRLVDSKRASAYLLRHTRLVGTNESRIWCDFFLMRELTLICVRFLELPHRALVPGSNPGGPTNSDRGAYSGNLREGNAPPMKACVGGLKQVVGHCPAAARRHRRANQPDVLGANKYHSVDLVFRRQWDRVL